MTHLRGFIEEEVEHQRKDEAHERPSELWPSQRILMANSGGS
jgi:hypothetical protein